MIIAPVPLRLIGGSCRRVATLLECEPPLRVPGYAKSLTVGNSPRAVVGLCKYHLPIRKIDQGC